MSLPLFGSFGKKAISKNTMSLFTGVSTCDLTQTELLDCYNLFTLKKTQQILRK